MTARIINIVEPTLESEAGHCHSFVSSFCAAGAGSACALRLFAGSRASLSGLENAGVQVMPYFMRRIRRLQLLALYRRLLREPGCIFVPTATRIDLSLLWLASGGDVPPGKAYLYFHWLRQEDGVKRSLAGMARRVGNVVVMGPTESVVRMFRECGFPNVLSASYPITPVTPDGIEAGRGFRHVLFAGAARMDKGFAAVVDLAAFMAENGRILPISIQASPDHYGRMDPRVQAEIGRLERIGHPSMELLRGTLPAAEYMERFRGAVCLQLYDASDFADRVSGVTLDALSCGCPVVSTAGTWMGRVAGRFDAGAVTESAEPERVMRAVEDVVADYPRYRQNALKAGDTLQRELCASRLFDIVAA